jgi:hypothetical protein
MAAAAASPVAMPSSFAWPSGIAASERARVPPEISGGGAAVVRIVSAADAEGYPGSIRELSAAVA